MFRLLVAGQEDGEESELYQIGDGVSELEYEVPEVEKEEEDEPGRGAHANRPIFVANQFCSLRIYKIVAISI